MRQVESGNEGLNREDHEDHKELLKLSSQFLGGLCALGGLTFLLTSRDGFSGRDPRL